MERMKEVGKTIIKVIVRIFILLIIIGIAAIAVQIYKHVKQEKRNEEYKQNYPNEIKKYLWDKYGTSFYINPVGKTYSSSPIPGKTYTPYIYEIQEEDTNGYVFNVCIYPESRYDNKIREIWDNYYWKYLNIQTKEWFRNELTGILPQEYKFILYSMYSRSYFDNDESLKPDLPLEGYYETRLSPVPLILYIVIPPNTLSQNTGSMEDDIKKVMNDFYKNYPNSSIELYLLQAEHGWDYKNVNERELENGRFYVYRERKRLRDIAEIETILKIEVGQKD